MNTISKPQSKMRVIDLLEIAGFDVSDWCNYKRGDTNPGANPKYCYEWSFIQDEKVLLNLWYSDCSINEEGYSFQDFNLKKEALNYNNERKLIKAQRAQKFDNALAFAFKNQLPIRVIVCQGKDPNLEADGNKGNQVKFRELDHMPWHVTRYCVNTGDCRITRGIKKPIYVDQHSVAQENNHNEKIKEQIIKVRPRRRSVRDQALRQAQGKCQYCGEKGFLTPDGRIYLETHHLVPLAKGGEDHLHNVVALCAKHHREAHLGKKSAEITEYLTLKDRKSEH